eukprot:549202_1
MPPSTNYANKVEAPEPTSSDSDLSTSTLGDSNSLFSESLGTATINGACCNYINLTVGGGVVAIPKAMVLCGYVPGGLMLIGYAFLACLNSYYIIVAGSLYKADTYQRVVRRAVGNTASWIAVFTLFLLNFGACIVTLQVIGHGCSDILKSASVDHPNIRDTIGWESLSVLVVSTVCILPLSLLRHVHNLVWSSYFSNVAVVAFITIMIIRGPHIRNEIEELANIEETPYASNSFRDQVIGMTTIVFNYCTGLSLSFGTYGSLRVEKQNLLSWWSVSVITMMICCSVYIVLGFAAAVLFGTSTPDDIILIFRPGDIAGNCGILFIVVSGILTFPLNLYTIRDIINQTVFISYLKQHEYAGTFRHATITIVSWAIITVIAIVYKGVLYIIALNGAICGTAIALLFPSLVYIKAMRKKANTRLLVDSNSKTNGPLWFELSSKYFVPCLSILAGTFCVIFGTVYAMWDIISGNQGDDGTFYE